MAAYIFHLMRMSRSRTIICLVLINSIFLFACDSPDIACEDPMGCIIVRPNDPIYLGYLLPITGSGSVIGTDILRGVEMGVSTLDNTLLGHAFLLEGFDTGCQNGAGQQAAERLAAAPTVVAVIGPGCSDVAEAAIPLIEASGGVLLTAGATAVGLDDPAINRGEAPSFYRFIPDYTVQAKTAARFARERLNVETAVSFHDGSLHFGRIQEQFIETFEQLGGTMAFSGQLTEDQTELVLQLGDILNTEPDLIYLAVSAPDANLILNKLVELNQLNGVEVIGTDFLLFPDFPLQTGSAALGMYITGTAIQGSEYDSFLATWIDKYGSPPEASYHIFAYDSVAVLVEAIESVAVVDNRGGILIEKSLLRQALSTTFQYDGISGQLTCSISGACFDETAVGVFQLSGAEISGEQWPPRQLALQN